MSVRIVYETHSITTDNEAGIATGWLPGALSERGVALAAELGRRRRNDGITRVITSDLQRAVQTAEVAFGSGTLPVEHDSAQRECDYGDLNGAPVAVLQPRRRTHVVEPWPNGESYLQVVQRTAAFLERLVAEHDGERVLLIAHSANRWALDVLRAGADLAQLVHADFAWQEGWEYEVPSGWRAPKRYRDWMSWHDSYADPASALSRRLERVREGVRLWLDAAPLGRLRIVSACAGDGRDVLDALAGHPRAPDVSALLVELDPRLAAAARERTRGTTADVEARVADAGLTSSYAGHLPADLVLLCGIFGNVVDADIRTTVRLLPGMCRPEATVIWTRHTRKPDLTPAIREWFREAGFGELGFDVVADAGVGVHRLRANPPPAPVDDVRLFRFT